MDQCAHLQSDLPTWHNSSSDELARTWQRAESEELANTVTHGLGLVIALVGALVMTSGVLARGDFWLAVGCEVYLFSLVAVYAMSTLSHGSTSPRWKPIFRQFDQAFIYMLIAGSYTPYSLVYLRGAYWWFWLAAIWTVALAGFWTKAFYAHRVNSVSIKTYLILGWMPIVAIPAIWRMAPATGFALIIGGGIWYMIGILFFVNDERVRHFHAAWHICVIAGSACHYLGMLACFAMV
jgi:hemolysin III